MRQERESLYDDRNPATATTSPTLLIMDISEEEAILWDEIAGIAKEDVR